MANVIHLRAKKGKTKKGKYLGREYTVVPVVALVEGVLHSMNAEHPALALADEFGKLPEAWNGRPVVFDHPVSDGAPVSANSPTILESYMMGTIFNAKLDGKKLKMEAWLDRDRAEELGEDALALVDKIDADEMIEISTGLFANGEEEEGEWEGKEYKEIWRNIVPDHLAFLPFGKVGACSVEGGCGAPRVNASPCECGGVCGSCGKDGKEPIVAEDTLQDTQGDDKVHTLRLDFAPLRASAVSEGVEIKSDETALQVIFANKSLSDVDKRNALSAALRKKTGDRYSYWYVMAIYDTEFVYEQGGQIYRRTYTIAEDGAVSLGEDLEEVRPEVEYVPVKVNQTAEPVVSKETIMANKEKVDGLIANAGTSFEEGDREWLMTLEDAQLDKLEPPKVEASEETEEPKVEAKEAPVANSASKTAEEYLAAMPAEMRAVFNSGLRKRNEHRDGLISTIKASARNKFSDEALKGFDDEMLENLAAFAEKEADYSGRGGPRTQAESDAIPAAPMVFPLEQSA